MIAARARNRTLLEPSLLQDLHGGLKRLPDNIRYSLGRTYDLRDKVRNTYSRMVMGIALLLRWYR